MVLDNNILRPRKTKRKLPLRKIVDADFVSSSNSSARIMDDLLLPSQHDRAILSELHNIRNSFDFNNRDKSLLPHIVLGLNNNGNKKKESKQVIVSPQVQTYKERLKSQASADWSLDLSGHSIIPITLAKDMTAKQQQQQRKHQEFEDDNDYTDDIYDDEQQDTNSETNQVDDETVNNINNTKEEVEDTSSKEEDTGSKEEHTITEELTVVENGRFKNEESGTEPIIVDVLMEEAEKVTSDIEEIKLDQVVEAEEHVKGIEQPNEVDEKDMNATTTVIKTPTSTKTNDDGQIKTPSFETPMSTSDSDSDDDLWINSIDSNQDDQVEKFYNYIFEKMSVKPASATTTETTDVGLATSVTTATESAAVAEVTVEEQTKHKKTKHKRSSSKKLDFLKKSRALDWLVNTSVCPKNQSSISKKRKRRLSDKLEQPYIIKKKIKSIWYIE